MAPLTRTLTLAATAALLSGCGDSITFPDVNSAVLAEFCIQGEIPVSGSTSRSGNVSSADCHTGIQNDGYFEGWHVRAGEVKTVTMEVASNFDSYLEVYRLVDVNDPAAGATLIGEDDDSGDDLNARVSVTLSPDTDYVVFVSGFSDAHTGPYTLDIN